MIQVGRCTTANGYVDIDAVVLFVELNETGFSVRSSPESKANVKTGVITAASTGSVSLNCTECLAN